MTVLSAQTLREMAIFSPHSERTRCPRTGTTYGLGPAGYDVRIAESLTLWPAWWSPADEPQPEGPFDRREWPRMRPSFSLASTIEHFSMPPSCVAFVHDKSTLARMGLAVQNTVVEPGWRGYLTLELTNHGNEILRLEPGDPIAQVVVHLLDAPTEQPYAGRYQDQARGPQPASRLTRDE